MKTIKNPVVKQSNENNYKIGLMITITTKKYFNPTRHNWSISGSLPHLKDRVVQTALSAVFYNLIFSVNEFSTYNKLISHKGTAYCFGSILASHPAVSGLISSFPKFYSEEKLSMLLKLIKGAGWRRLDRGLKMFIEPIVVDITN